MQLEMLLGNPDCVYVCVFLTKKVACSACTEQSVVTTALAVGHEDSRRIAGPEKDFKNTNIYI